MEVGRAGNAAGSIPETDSRFVQMSRPLVQVSRFAQVSRAGEPIRAGESSR
jgi:hypothetical protein